jgi:hypothetical protein
MGHVCIIGLVHHRGWVAVHGRHHMIVSRLNPAYVHSGLTHLVLRELMYYQSVIGGNLLLAAAAVVRLVEVVTSV